MGRVRKKVDKTIITGFRADVLQVYNKTIHLKTLLYVINKKTNTKRRINQLEYQLQQYHIPYPIQMNI